MTEPDQALIESFRSHGQEHVFQFLNELQPEEATALLEQARSIDLSELDQLVDTYVKQDVPSGIDFSEMEPSSYIPHYELHPDRKKDWEVAHMFGVEALKHGRVAAFTVAGGQGTRLGYDGPKGTFPVTPVTQSSLFEVFAKKIAFAERTYGAPIYWFIMTSEVNHEATVAFFRKNDFFGLEHHRVQFFSQGLMPAVDLQGKLILEEKHRLVMTPDGHGGSLRALNRSGAVQLMEELGIQVISYFQVDNPLIKVIDPYFIGFHLQHKAELSSKMIPKAYPLEKVGHFCDYRGKQMVVEYSDLPAEYQEQRDAEGNLRFIAGSIAIHIMDVGFVKKLGAKGSSLQLPFHKAVKKIPYIDDQGQLQRPSEPNGVKFEMFVFDALPFAERNVLIETLREEDFSPVKNAEGVDSPETCRQHQLRLWAKWLRQVGVELEVDADGVPLRSFEIDPSFAVDGDSFVKAWKALDTKPEITDGLVLRSAC